MFFDFVRRRKIKLLLGSVTNKMKISIITVSYNSVDTLEDTIRSVLKQNYDDIEYIIVDGNSSDNTLELIKKYEKKFKDSSKSYKWISETDNGIYDALNKGIKLANGDIIGFLNSDDYYSDEEVVSDINIGFQENDIDCLYGNLKYIDSDNDKVVRDWQSREFEKGLFEKSWSPAHPTFYCKKSIYDKFGNYKTDYKIAADVELMYRFLEKHEIKSKFLDRYMVIMRQGGVSTSGLKSTYIITKEVRRAILENNGNFNIFKYLFYKMLKLKEFIKR